MIRRKFITLLGGAAVAWPLAARAQQGDRVRRIGVLPPGDENDRLRKSFVSALTQVLADLGWTEGRNVRIDLRWYGDDINRIRALAQDLVGLRPDIVLTSSTPAIVALQRETRTIPIVFGSGTDPVATGIVPRLDRPSGNMMDFSPRKARVMPCLSAFLASRASPKAGWGCARAAATLNRYAALRGLLRLRDAPDQTAAARLPPLDPGGECTGTTFGTAGRRQLAGAESQVYGAR
jgi:hypothetical protein